MKNNKNEIVNDEVTATNDVAQNSAAATDAATTNTAAPTAAPKKIVKVQSLPVTGTFSLTEKGYLKTVLDNPFPDEPLGELTLVFENPNRTDNFGRSDDRSGSRFEGAFRFCTRRACTDGVTSVHFTGECTYKRMKDKKNNVSSFVSISINSPFLDADINDNKPVRVFFREGAAQGEFDLVAKMYLELVDFEGFLGKRRF